MCHNRKDSFTVKLTRNTKGAVRPQVGQDQNKNLGFLLLYLYCKHGANGGQDRVKSTA